MVTLKEDEESCRIGEEFCGGALDIYRGAISVTIFSIKRVAKSYHMIPYKFLNPCVQEIGEALMLDFGFLFKDSKCDFGHVTAKSL